MKIKDIIRYLDPEDNLIMVSDYDTEDEIFYFWTTSYYEKQLTEEQVSIIETVDIELFDYSNKGLTFYIKSRGNQKE